MTVYQRTRQCHLSNGVSISYLCGTAERINGHCNILVWVDFMVARALSGFRHDTVGIISSRQIVKSTGNNSAFPSLVIVFLLGIVASTT